MPLHTQPAAKVMLLRISSWPLCLHVISSFVVIQAQIMKDELARLREEASRVPALEAEVPHRPYGSPYGPLPYYLCLVYPQYLCLTPRPCFPALYPSLCSLAPKSRCCALASRPRPFCPGPLPQPLCPSPALLPWPLIPFSPALLPCHPDRASPWEAVGSGGLVVARGVGLTRVLRGSFDQPISRPSARGGEQGGQRSEGTTTAGRRGKGLEGGHGEGGVMG